VGWKWNQTAHRYYNTDTGRFLTHARALEFIEQGLAASGSVVDNLAAYVADGLLAPGDWYTLMAREVKGEYIRQYLAGIGGRAQMTQADWGSIGGMLKEQYGHLQGFMEEIAQGKLSEAQIRARARMYTNSAREAYERAHAKVAGQAGNDQEIWVLSAAEHCEDCLAFAAENWQPLGHFPMPGAGHTKCLTNCGCHLGYRKSETGEVWGEEVA
jgi:hypothetical protein